MKNEKMELFVVNLWACASEPASSVPTTQSQKRGGDYRAMASNQGMLNEG